MIGADIDSSTAKIVENISKINSEQVLIQFLKRKSSNIFLDDLQ